MTTAPISIAQALQQLEQAKACQLIVAPYGDKPNFYSFTFSYPGIGHSNYCLKKPNPDELGQFVSGQSNVLALQGTDDTSTLVRACIIVKDEVPRLIWKDDDSGASYVIPECLEKQLLEALA